MLPKFGPVELILILVIVTMLFGVGKLPEMFGAVGRGVREFRKASEEPDTTTGTTTVTTTVVEQPPSDSTQPPVA
jgi:sec-independent protein translocase protein TatA